MNTNTLITYIIAVFLTCAIPGPNMLHMMSSASRFGLRRTFAAMFGCMLAVLSLLTASAIGLGAVLQTSPQIFMILRYLGAAYLGYLGIKIWLTPFYSPLDPETGIILQPVSKNEIFRRGFLVGISNPKAMIFAAAFFPQFIDPTAPQIPQFVILLGIFIIVESGWYLTYALSGAAISGFLRQPKIQFLFKTITGSMFIAFGLLMLVYKQ